MHYTSYQQIVNSTPYKELRRSPFCDRILRRAQKEKSISQLYSVLDNESRTFAEKTRIWRENLVQSMHEIPRDEYLKRLSEQERVAIQNLFCSILWNSGFYYKDSIFYSHGFGVMAVGSTTYPDTYREGLENAGELSESTKKRIQQKGNDIDLLLHDVNINSDNFLAGDRFWSNNGHGTDGLIKNISQCLEINNIDYEIVEDKHKIGTTILTSRGKVIESDLINYGDYPCFIIYFPNIRPIHLKLSNESGNNVLRREYLQARNFCSLFDRAFNRFELSELIRKINVGEELHIPKTLEEKLLSLDQWKRSNYQITLLQRKQQKKSKNIENFTSDEDFPF